MCPRAEWRFKGASETVQGWLWWRAPLIPALGSQRQTDLGVPAWSTGSRTARATQKPLLSPKR